MDTYSYIICRITGDCKRVITTPYLRKHGYTKEQYQKQFPTAPLSCEERLDAYRDAARSARGREIRSLNMSQNNKSKTFQKKRIQGMNRHWESEDGIKRKEQHSERAKIQHQTTDLGDRCREYFNTTYIGSEDQLNRSKRMRENNPSHNPAIVKKQKEGYIISRQLGNVYKRKTYKDTHLTYQSTYEKDFLDFYFTHNYQINDIDNAPILNDELYPAHMYEPDYIYKEKYIIEIKSWYIANLQEKQKNFDVLIEKEQLVLRKGYLFVYLLDKDYTPFLQLEN